MVRAPTTSADDKRPPETVKMADPVSYQTRAIRLWLYAVAALVLAMVLDGRVRAWALLTAALVFAMVMVGGATRLTESGLSITEWQPVMGVVPPLDDSQWQLEFQKYQAIPQYRELNNGMSLDAFKTIYWWEWTHRLIGRTIGVVFLLPLLWFLWRGWVGPGLRTRLWLIFGLGALQGAVGWWMVASGLVHRVEVSQYRLATHLVLACIIYIAILWTAQRLDDQESAPAPGAIRATAIGLLIMVLGQIYLGALVAGLRAGYVYNTWPLIDGALVPDASRLFFDVPLWRNFFENTLTAQFDHRMLAYTIWIVALIHAVNVARTVRTGPVVAGAIILAAAVTLQAALGIFTLLMAVPISLALMHQAMAMVVLTVATVQAAMLTERAPRAVAAPARV
jgi:cytochrome c oxidase assembly protein subunit 15